MASKSVFTSASTSSTSALPATNTTNLAGGRAYSLSAKEALAQIAATGCFNHTFYASAANQLDQVKELAGQVEPRFLAKVAVYARSRGFMKDMPAFLLGYLSGKLTEVAKQEEAAYKAGKKEEGRVFGQQVAELSGLLTAIFPRVVDNPKMLRNYVQIVRSGQAGRKSLGSAPRRLVTGWFDGRTPEQLFLASVGNDPSLGDILSLAHPSPKTVEQAAIYGHLLAKDKGKFDGKDFTVAEMLPGMVQEYLAFKAGPEGKPLPKAPYEMLEGLPLTKEQWVELAQRSSWQQVRQHLNTFQKKGVFDSKLATKAIADKLRDPELIRKARAMPYQLLMAYTMTDGVPQEIRNALQDAVEIATENIPVINGTVCIFPDISGSMQSPVTGTRVNPKTGKVETHTSKVSCLDVAALVAASVLRKNPEARVIPFSDDARINVKLNPRDSIMTNAAVLRNLPSGGTECSAPMAAINQLGITPDLVWYVSDNESWIDPKRDALRASYYGRRTGAEPTSTVIEWAKVKSRNPKAQLVCMDLSPNSTTQAPSTADTLNVGGFSDVVFEAVAAFHGGLAGSWVEMIDNAVDL